MAIGTYRPASLTSSDMCAVASEPVSSWCVSAVPGNIHTGLYILREPYIAVIWPIIKLILIVDQFPPLWNEVNTAFAEL